MRFLLLLLYQKKYMTMLVGLGMGVVYMLVDYGVFHLICHSRSISDEYSLFWVLLWMSMSYGFTNFTWIWLCLSKDEHLPEWSLLILSWWFCCPLLTQTFVLNAVPIVIQRTTGAYHGYMALILFGWEAALLLGGIRSAGFATAGEKLHTLVVNSLLETNLGMPYVYGLYIAYSRRFTEQLGRRAAPLSFSERIAENNQKQQKKRA